jgi:hypothetical protein
MDLRSTEERVATLARVSFVGETSAGGSIRRGAGAYSGQGFNLGRGGGVATPFMRKVKGVFLCVVVHYRATRENMSTIFLRGGGHLFFFIYIGDGF